MKTDDSPRRLDFTFGILDTQTMVKAYQIIVKVSTQHDAIEIV